ncbi:MAG: zinc-ribbon domain-containing protein [Desulfuromonadales bacterium]|nr:zinc-ribbon domain-containing protein [Desulfuromonadales bacterium]
MIIVCPECSTKFKVNTDRIPEGGAKVRCARCKQVFTIQKPLEPEESIATEAIQEVAAPPTDSDETAADDSTFSYDMFKELDSEPTAEEKVEEEQEEDDDNFSYAELAKELAAAAAADAGASNTEEVAAETEKETTTVAKPKIPKQPATEKKGGPIASIIRILLLLILGILIIGGVFVYINGTDQLDQTIQQILGQQSDRPVQTGQITLSELEGKFILNEQAGELFLIRGEAINSFSDARAAIQVKGVIFDQNGKPLRQKTVFCGNPISDKELLTLSFAELEKIMGNQFGKELSNMKINSKQPIPFDIIFKDLPKDLSEFSVKVTSSQPASE